jgi:sigma-54-specific transcriptional regulator
LFATAPAELYRSLEDLIVRRAFAYCGSNQVQTARLLGISRNIARTLLKRIGLIANEGAPETYGELDAIGTALQSVAPVQAGMTN